MLDATGAMRDVSPAFEAITGYSPEEMIATSGTEFIHPDDLAKIGRVFAEVVAGDTSLTTEYRVKHRDGSWHWPEGTFTNLLADPAVEGGSIPAAVSSPRPTSSPWPRRPA